MTDEEAKRQITALIEEKFREGMFRMRSFTRCREIYNKMKMQGYSQEMETFKSFVLMATISHPDWSEIDILKDLADYIGIKTEEYA